MYVPSLAYSKDQPNNPEYSQGIISITKRNVQYIVLRYIVSKWM